MACKSDEGKCGMDPGVTAGFVARVLHAHYRGLVSKSLCGFERFPTILMILMVFSFSSTQKR